MNYQARYSNTIEEQGRNELKERTEIECHECGRMIYADIDLGINGNHVIICPCKHEHCRVVRNGRITSSRWANRNTIVANYVAFTTTASTSQISSIPYWSSSSSTTVWLGS